MIGMNYRKHAEEINLPIPKYPVLFYKPISSINGPHDDIELPEVTRIEQGKIDHEAELVIIIGKKGKNIKIEDSLSHVLGYTAGNDVSQRTWQLERGGSQFSTGKMFDTWAPIGPAIISSNLIPNPNNLQISSKVNNKLRQNSNTNELIFNIEQLITFLSQGTTLLPGDLIFTGTPKGVGSGFNPPKWLKNDDIVEINIENIGSIKNTVKNV
ncbi:Fumarylacetoacetate hydrolase domain-containing protein [Wickerhamomyces ciferrii]|uniref:Fumarylacetoacetate hydrolase domain-containing protein n=1 Tax=Wickerhamomyces ciferrii (strain ATCC 14091 / BCRC 22168 / CBS 111 / JCM 3599 / NBRC 0793 / NRRL Y-1031 F-60-10) TaxID=1206466 RepID=K0KLK1_WICCF|nr:Fumarylacetoacetate hydrolase domain-containing protein [Wickerhamomyces ciferrii]CCH41998.1 Fumarylacetoacetate hydrolase domain-containing protein [Wickerhamomyces ciferrii]